MSSRPITYVSNREGAITIDLRVVCWNLPAELEEAEVMLDRAVVDARADLQRRRAAAVAEQDRRIAP